MTSNTTKWSSYRRIHQQAAAYEKHFQTMHLDMVLSLHANADLTAAGPPAFVRNENINQSALDYESDHRLEIGNGRAASSEIDDNMQNDSDTEDVSHPPV